MILDGGMGTELQTYKLEEHEYRGKYFTKLINNIFIIGEEFKDVEKLL